MGQKVHPYGFRLGALYGWKSNWFEQRRYGEQIHEDFRIRKYIKKKLYHAGIAQVVIDRTGDKVVVNIHTARPGILIGKRGAEVEVLRQELAKFTGHEIFINIKEIRKAELDAQLVAENVALQLERRVAFRRAMKKAMTSTMKFGAGGIRIETSGRLGGAEGFNARRGSFSSLGGQFEADNWFRGNAEFFGGVAWQATDDLQLKVEYSSDDYVQETTGGIQRIEDQVNVALDYRVSDSVSVQAFYMYGANFGAMINFINNPKRSVAPSGQHPAPFPVRSRPPGAGRDLGWANDAPARAGTRQRLAEAMANEGLVIEAMDLQSRSVEIHLRNPRYSFNAEAIGRTVRVLTQVMPDSVETFRIVPVVRGVPLSSVTISRSDAERFEHATDGAEQMLARARIGEAPRGRPAEFDDTLYPRFTWGLGPYARASYFDPDEPVYLGFGLELNAEYALAPGLYLSGAVRQRLGGNIGKSDRVSDSVLPKVRSESNIYSREGETALTDLTLAYYFRPGDNLYGRVTAGYLESQYGGLSAELLWKPVESRFAVGAEINYVRQREFAQGFGFRDYEVATGHVSGYWEMGNGFHAQVDAGRYLAGDWGATFALDREFDNGWSVGAYATFTDVSFEDFGEGSFDKGLRFTIPLSPLLGQPTRREFNATIRPLTRDGGARVEVNGRLYETVRDYHASGLESSWGRFWR